jgi:hypothetical protein
LFSAAFARGDLAEGKLPLASKGMYECGGRLELDLLYSVAGKLLFAS